MLKTLIISKFAGPVIRHAGTVVSGYLVADGIADENTAQQIAAGVVAVLSLGLSWFEKEARGNS